MFQFTCDVLVKELRNLQYFIKSLSLRNIIISGGICARSVSSNSDKPRDFLVFRIQAFFGQLNDALNAYSRASMARILMAWLPRLFRTRP